MRSDQKKVKSNIDLASGVMTGILNAAIFNPLDKALYRSSIYCRPLFCHANFVNPWQGIGQSVSAKCLSDGCYFFLQSQVAFFLHHEACQIPMTDWQERFGTGLIAGSMRGLVINWSYAIRHYTWSHEGSTFYSSVSHMWQGGNWQPFIRGTRAMVTRDAVFGIVYEIARQGKDQDGKPAGLARNIAAGSLAAIVSSPFNFWRSMEHALPVNEKSTGMVAILSDLKRDVLQQAKTIDKAKILKRRLLIGPGSLRVGMGIALGQLFFGNIRQGFEKVKQLSNSEEPEKNRAAIPARPGAKKV